VHLPLVLSLYPTRMKINAIDLDRTLRRIYYDPKNPAAFSSISKLYKACRLENPNVTYQSVKDWLAGERGYGLHKPTRHVFSRNKCILSRADEQWQADLVDMQAFKAYNQGCSYLLTVIDMFSKYAFVIPLKNKNASTLKVAFKEIFSHKRVPEKLQTDQGTEFENRILGVYLHSMGVKHFTTTNRQIKCAVVERFNRTLKNLLYKYMTARRTKEYLDVLQDFVASYNRTKHGVTKMRPIDVGVYDLEDRERVFKNTYGYTNLRELIMHQVNRDKSNSSDIKKGDLVRVAKLRKTFQRGFKPNWSDSLYRIRNVIKRLGKPVYEIIDMTGHVKHKKFYPEEVQKITRNMLNAARVLQTRTKNGVVQQLIQWNSYAPEKRCWVNASDLSQASI
jgi:transposase InsO family protein